MCRTSEYSCSPLASRSGWFISRPQSISGPPHRCQEAARPHRKAAVMTAIQNRSRVLYRALT